MKFLFPFWVLLAFILCNSCIPIEDKISPQIQDFSIERSYFYKDTIQFSAVFVDNYGLDSGSIEIQKFPLETGAEHAWYYQCSFEIAGRRIAPDFSIAVPSYKETGTYQLTVYGFDEGANPDTLLRIFQLHADTTLPSFIDTKIGLPKQRDGTYIACRSEVIPIEGLVTDNMKLRLFGFSWNERKPNLTVNLKDSISITDFFNNQLIIPSYTENGTTLQLNLIAVDTFDNVAVKSFDILVDCDDQSPTFQVKRAFPRINQHKRAFVTQGGTLLISELMVRDDQFLNKAWVYFQKQGEDLSLFDEVTLNTPDTVNLNDYIDLAFAIPLSDNPGTVYEVGIMAEDSSGNLSAMLEINVEVVEDTPPEIVVTDMFLNNEHYMFNPAPTHNIVPKGSAITLKGKIEEEYILENIQVFWYLEGDEIEPLNTWNNIRNLPVSLADLHKADTFVVPYNATTGQVYVLKIMAQDRKGQLAYIEYFLEVGS